VFRGANERSSPRRLRLARAIAAVGVVLALLLTVYVGLVQSGLVRSPFGPVVGGEIALARGDRAGLRVLFVGNSFTASNAMPELVHELAEADDDPLRIFSVSYTAGGWSLRRASQDAGLTALLQEVRWDVVVLQERSFIPSLPAARRHEEMHPYARALDAKIVHGGARTMLFMTWGYEGGDEATVSGDTFAAMQSRLEDGYSELATELSSSVSVAPVGLAWAEALRRDPELELWARDGQHPSRAGSYLAACVFYTLLARREPAGSKFTAGLHPATARLLQRSASDIAASR
jgi:hypothetical protein